MLLNPNPETVVTGLIFIPELCETATDDLTRSFMNVIRALGELHIEVQESEVKALIYYGKLSVDEVDTLERELCAPSIHLISVKGQYKNFSGSEGKCQLILRPIDE